jgi:putative PIN family toxin of toxin-antitoxin system
MRRRIVLDTNVIVAALRSQRGASAAVLSRAGTRAYEHCLSVALILEYEAACKRPASGLAVPNQMIDDILDYLARTARHQPIHFLWRPALPDPADDHVLELAVAAGGAAIITHNHRDFVGAKRFGVAVLNPRALLRQLLQEEELT